VVAKSSVRAITDCPERSPTKYEIKSFESASIAVHCLRRRPQAEPFCVCDVPLFSICKVPNFVYLDTLRLQASNMFVVIGGAGATGVDHKANDGVFADPQEPSHWPD
jgi:hypothetical protein